MDNKVRCATGFIIVLYEWALESPLAPIVAAIVLLILLEPFRMMSPGIYWSILAAIIILWTLNNGDKISRIIEFISPNKGS